MQKKSFVWKLLAVNCCYMELSEFLKEHLKGRGAQAKFARASGISDGTVSKWAKGNIDRAPNFENCLRIATGMRENPFNIFQMAEKPEFAELFLKLFPDYNSDPLLTEDSVCCMCNNESHRILQQMLDEMLHDKQYAPWISANVVNLHAGMRQERPRLALVVNGETEQSPGRVSDPTLEIKRECPKK